MNVSYTLLEGLLFVRKIRILTFQEINLQHLDSLGNLNVYLNIVTPVLHRRL